MEVHVVIGEISASGHEGVIEIFRSESVAEKFKTDEGYIRVETYTLI